MNDWRSQLPYDPVSFIRQAENPALDYFVRRDLLDEDPGSAQNLWELPPAQRLLKQQEADGSWRYAGKKGDEVTDYRQLETFRNLGLLVEKYAFTYDHPAIQAAVEFLFSRQTEVGDFRGIYGAQYTPNYSAAILELIVKSGCLEDYRLRQAYDWLLDIRQADGGWAIPLLTAGYEFTPTLSLPQTIEPDRDQPFSHMVTGVVLRAFAAHPLERNLQAVQYAGFLMLTRLFHRDKYPGRREKHYWERVSFPFWFTDIVSTLDALSKTGFNRSHPPLASALDWLAKRQQPDGSFDLILIRGADPDSARWVALSVARIYRRLFPAE